MSLFAELKRRNVFKVGVAYGVASWLILQLTEVLAELMQLNTDIGKIVIILLVVGFIPALIFAWAFEMTPEGVKREKDVDRSQSITPKTGKKLNNTILALMALAIAYLLFDKFSVEGPDPIPTPATGVADNSPAGEPDPALDIKAEEPPVINRQSIAVLPFDNRSNREEDEFFVEGIHDDLLTNLARIGSLKVISRTSVNLYQDSRLPIPEIARELGVASIMEGAVQRAGNTVRINVQLIDAETDEHLWAEIYDRELTTENLFAIQTEISERIASALQATLSPEEQQRISEFPTRSLDAYNAYLRGRQLIANRDSAGLETALQEFERAVEFDPEFALAWVGVAETNRLLPEYGTAPLGPSIQRTDLAVTQALEINPELGEAYASLAQVAEYKNQLDAAELAYRKAIDLNPGYPTTYHWYANFLRDFRGPQRYAEAIDLLRAGLELDPHSAIIQQNIYGNYGLAGKFNLAEQSLKDALELNPEFPGFMWGLSNLYAFNLGQLDKAAFWSRKNSDLNPGSMSAQFRLYMRLLALGTDELAGEVLIRMKELDADHGLVSLAGAFTALRDGRKAAVEEETQHLERLKGWEGTLAFLFAQTGRWDKARMYLLRDEPGYLDRQQWSGLLARNGEGTCNAAEVLFETGDTELADELIELSLDYLVNELPKYIEHSDRYWGAKCHMLRGNVDAAIVGLQTAIDHGHELNDWWAWSTSPSWIELRLDPRYEALAQQVEETLSPQRARVEKMFEEWKGGSL